MVVNIISSMAKTKFPLYSPGKNCENNKNSSIIVADLRKFKSILAVYDSKDGDINLNSEKEYKTDDFASLAELAKQFIKDMQVEHIKRVSVAVPGPVINGFCETQNLPWKICSEEVKNDLGLEKFYLINDLEATAYSLANVYDNKFETIHTSVNKIPGNVAILAPGNGLGEAGLFYDGEFLRPFATEGGHTEFSPRNETEVEFYHFLNKINGIVTWESVLTKNGMYNIYRFLRDIGRHEEEEWLKKRMKEGDFVDVIATVGKEKKSRLVKLTISTFLEYLAREANNMVLKLKATGGLIITGEIVEKIFNLIEKDKFYKNFLISDKMENLLKDIPIYILRNDKEILEGAAYYGTFFEE